MKGYSMVGIGADDEGDIFEAIKGMAREKLEGIQEESVAYGQKDRISFNF